MGPRRLVLTKRALRDLRAHYDYILEFDPVAAKRLLHEINRKMEWIAELGMTPSSQARIISALRTFYKYCLLEDITTVDPTALLEAPKLIAAKARDTMLIDEAIFQQVQNDLDEDL